MVVDYARALCFEHGVVLPENIIESAMEAVARETGSVVVGGAGRVGGGGWRGVGLVGAVVVGGLVG